MKFKKTIAQLLTTACPSIRYRIRREVLGERASTAEMKALRKQVLRQPRVLTVLSSRESDGWSTDMGYFPALHNRCGIEVAFRILREAGIATSHPAFASGLAAMDRVDKPWREIVQDGCGGGWAGFEAIVRSLGGQANSDFVKHEAGRAVAAFRFVTEVEDFDRLIGKGKKPAFRKGCDWPGVHHMELLVNTTAWRTKANLAIVAAAIPRMMAFYPRPESNVQGKSLNFQGGETAYSVVWQRVLPNLPASGGAWWHWLVSMERFARIGIVQRSPELLQQVTALESLLRKSAGWFREDVTPWPFLKWERYTGLALEAKTPGERVWEWESPQGQTNDLTFRSLLILHYSGLLGV